MRVKSRICQPIPDYVVSLRVYRDEEGWNWMDPFTGLVVYTTPIRPTVAQARERAKAWARYHHFKYRIATGCYERKRVAP